MNQQTPNLRRWRIALFAGLVALMISGLLVALAPGAGAAVYLLYFKATAGTDKILLEWETATEQDTLGFNLYRSRESYAQGTKIGDTFPSRGDAVSGAKYSYTDTDVQTGISYYYSLEEIAAGGGGLKIIATANAGIDVPTFTPTATATASATASPTLTPTPTSTNISGIVSDGQPTATRQSTNTPTPVTPVPAPGLAATLLPGAPATATRPGGAIVSTPTGRPQPPTAPPLNAAETSAPALPAPAASATPAAISSAAGAAAGTALPAFEPTPVDTPPPQVFAAATGQPVLATPGTPAAAPAPGSSGVETRNTRTFLLVGGAAILLAAALGAGVLWLWRSRQRQQL